MHVAAPPNGSISVGWLCVSFLNRSSQGSFCPSMSASMRTVQALISSDSSRSMSAPVLFKYLAPMVARSISVTGFSMPSSFRRERYVSYVRWASGSSNVAPVISVRNVVWRQWSDQ